MATTVAERYELDPGRVGGFSDLLDEVARTPTMPAIAEVSQLISLGVDVVPSDIGLAGVETAGRNEPGQEALREVDGYDLALIDCSPQLGLLAVNALAAAAG